VVSRRTLLARKLSRESTFGKVRSGFRMTAE
jgi:hypothetical protein